MIIIMLKNKKKSNNQVISFVITLGQMELMKAYIAARAQLVTFILFILGIGSKNLISLTKVFAKSSYLIKDSFKTVLIGGSSAYLKYLSSAYSGLFRN